MFPRYALVKPAYAALRGLQMGITQGLLGALIADIAPDRLRGTAFGLYDFANGIGTLLASSAAGFLWMTGGPSLTFGFSACIATVAALMLLVRPIQTTNAARYPARPTVFLLGGLLDARVDLAAQRPEIDRLSE